ncbi:hypothetical protein KY290_014308 [Solanum tuberosum]|uniref:Purine transporter n=1 Tax=Solanum tuberosum TaxID=4113 RepID=A0ABQ7VRY1_SOLTU|nr:hypothetical protein KY289_014368 [Solanum tuberosum]KAH0699491.1 hypothetical protein KY284_013706 [Solanum tuberosum]KAH0770327.1 hypothetical protein KY290_014308 [Solanum tuberosum]
MGTVAEKELDIINVQEETDPKTKKMDALIVIPTETPNSVNKYTKWLEIGIYALIVLVSQSVATILGKLYYNKGGKIGVGCGLFSIGLLHLPASTFSLISSSQLAFNVLFSLFMKLEKITPLIANSIALVTISSLLLALDSSNKASSSSLSNHHNAIGFICTLIASALFGLLFSLTDLLFRKFFKKNTLREFMDVSAVFANVITTLSAPLIPIMSVIIFNDKMSGVKAISIVLAIWGFSSYAYQQYLDELNHKGDRNGIEDDSTDRQTTSI